MLKVCLKCTKRYSTKYKNQKFCSVKCYDKKGVGNPKWRGGEMIVDGYKYILKPDHPFATKQGYICEHRFVMEKHLGRYLEKGEAVHHLNHNRLDNRIENLHLCPSNGKHFIENHLISRDKSGRFHKVQKSL